MNKYKLSLSLFICSILLALIACENDSDKKINSDKQINKLLSHYDVKDLIPDTTKIENNRNLPLQKLGMELFFSKSLSGNFDVACVSCHHPLLAGGDSLSLPVGESPYIPELLGLGRWHDWRASKDDKADGAPNVARHSPTTFNSALYKDALFHDGRVFVLSKDNNKIQHRSPDSRFTQADANAGKNLLATQTRFPVTSNEEMRGFTFAHGQNNTQLRQALVERIKGNTDELAAKNQWLSLFQLAFNQPSGSKDVLITFENIQNALASYQSSQLFIDNPWYQYIEGDLSAISEQQKRGALLFFNTSKKGGANCSSCHQPPAFTDEKYHNIAMPQFGRGKRANHEDFGRRGVSQVEQDRYAFRTPSLLNVANTAPYGHTGAYLSLKGVIEHHLNPEQAINNYDFTFSDNPQLHVVANLYHNAESLSQGALKQLLASQKNNRSMLPSGIKLTPSDLNDLIAFLQALTDPCITSDKCLQPWIPNKNEASPDDQRLDAVFSSEDATILPPKPIRTLGEQKSNTSSAIPPMQGSQTPIIDYSCNSRNNRKFTAGSMNSEIKFHDVTQSAGITAKHEIATDIFTVINMQRLGYSGGAAAGDINGDCFNDIYYVTGSTSVDALYMSNKDGTFSNKAKQWGIKQKELSNGATFADLDGDGDLDLLTTNIKHPTLPAITKSEKNSNLVRTTSYKNQSNYSFEIWPEMTIEASIASWTLALADYDSDGDLDVLSTHWQFSPPFTNHLWNNKQGEKLIAFDGGSNLQDIRGSKDITWTGIFSDINNDGYADILMTSDFEDSQIFLNKSDGSFTKTTYDSQLTDENGMGAAVIDIDNDGDLDWFMTSIWDPTGKAPANRNWAISGNRLYQNNNGTFSDITEKAGVREGYWGWGSCFADFNNDGWPDLFHVNGIDVPDYVVDYILTTPLATKELFTDIKQFRKTPSRLYISNKDGTFTERSKEFNITDTRAGHTALCFDYDRDGDVDIFITNNLNHPILYQNNASSQKDTNFINIRLKGLGKNTQAIGAKVYVTANGITQLQEVQAGGTFLGGNPAELHFGLSGAASIDKIEVVWPQPHYYKHQIKSIKSNQFISIEQPLEY